MAAVGEAPTLFLRKATGLVKGWSKFDAFLYSFMSVNFVTLGLFFALSVADLKASAEWYRVKSPTMASRAGVGIRFRPSKPTSAQPWSSVMQSTMFGLFAGAPGADDPAARMHGSRAAASTRRASARQASIRGPLISPAGPKA